MVPRNSDTASFFIAISRAVVCHVDGDSTAPDLLVWSAGALPKRRSCFFLWEKSGHGLTSRPRESASENVE